MNINMNMNMNMNMKESTKIGRKKGQLFQKSKFLKMFEWTRTRRASIILSTTLLTFQYLITLCSLEGYFKTSIRESFGVLWFYITYLCVKTRDPIVTDLALYKCTDIHIIQWAA